MKVVLLTQDEPLFLVPAIDYLLARAPAGIEIAGCVVFDPSPLGKKVGMIGRAKELLRVFGPGYFARYAIRFATARMQRSRSLAHVLRRYGVPELRLQENVNAPQSLEAIRSFEPDLLVSIAGNQIFRRALIDLAPKGCLNLHSALLPRYRGLMPTFWAMKNGETETGVSVFFVDEGIDSGPIVVQKRVPIDTDSLEELIRRTKTVGMDAVWEAVGKIRSSSVDLLPNPETEKTYFSFPTRADVRAFRAAGKRLY
jgi:methionyl-tRNA formyltransferase